VATDWPFRQDYIWTRCLRIASPPRRQSIQTGSPILSPCPHTAPSQFEITVDASSIATGLSVCPGGRMSRGSGSRAGLAVQTKETGNTPAALLVFRLTVDRTHAWMTPRRNRTFIATRDDRHAALALRATSLFPLKCPCHPIDASKQPCMHRNLRPRTAVLGRSGEACRQASTPAVVGRGAHQQAPTPCSVLKTVSMLGPLLHPSLTNVVDVAAHTFFSLCTDTHWRALAISISNTVFASPPSSWCRIDSLRHRVPVRACDLLFGRAIRSFSSHAGCTRIFRRMHSITLQDHCSRH